MRKELIQYLDQRQDIRYFIRIHPIWYRRLSRNPSLISRLEKEVDEFFGRTFNKKVEKFGQSLNMLSMMLQMATMLGGEAASTPNENEKT